VLLPTTSERRSLDLLDDARTRSGVVPVRAGL
jgi:hypothetical protein